MCDCAVSLRFSMTYSTQERWSTQTRRWTSLHLLSYANSCSTRTTTSIRTRLRTCDSTPSSRNNAPPMDWVAASGMGIKVALDIWPVRKLRAVLRGTFCVFTGRNCVRTSLEPVSRIGDTARSHPSVFVLAHPLHNQIVTGQLGGERSLQPWRRSTICRRICGLLPQVMQCFPLFRSWTPLGNPRCGYTARISR